MQMVGRHDDDRLDAVGPRRLGARHLAVVGIGAVGREADLGGRGGGVLRIGRQRAGDQRDAVVETHRQTVHGADEGAASAPDHSDPQAGRAGWLGGGVDHVALLPDRCAASMRGGK